MRWSFLNNDFKPQKKEIAPAVIAAGITAAGAIGNNILSGSYSDHASKESRKWQEAMYEKYYSPQAQMRQYREAGVNPLLMSQGSGLSAQSMPQGQQAVTPNFENVGEASLRGASLFSELEYNAAASSNQRMQSVMNEVNAINDAFSKAGYKAGMTMIQQLLPDFEAKGFDEHTVMKWFESQRLEYDAQACIMQVKAKFEKEHGYEKAMTDLEGMNQQIAESIGKLGLMSSQADLNRASEKQALAQAKELGARLAVDFAQAGYFKALGSQISQLTPYLVFNALLGNGSLAMQYLTQEGEFSQNQYIRDWQHTEKAKSTRKYTNSMKPSNNVVGAFMDGFVSKVPTPWHQNAVDSYQNAMTEYNY